MKDRIDKRYLVGIPVPSLDRKGVPLEDSEIELWTRRTLDKLTACFGGATPVPAPGENIVQGPDGEMVTLFEQGQTLVLAACDKRETFLKKRDQIAEFAEEMADALRQEAVFVLAFPSDSFLVEGIFQAARDVPRE